MLRSIIAVFVLLSVNATFADDFSDRRQAQQRKFYEDLEQRSQQREMADEVKLRAGVQAFAARHGGFLKGPVEQERDGHWPFGITFTTFDNLACSAWVRCRNAPISLNCIDGQLKNHSFGPKLCSL